MDLPEGDMDMNEISVGDALSYFPSKNDQFFQAKDGPTILLLRKFIHAQPDNSTFPIRGRDWTKEGDFTEWEMAKQESPSENKKKRKNPLYLHISLLLFGYAVKTGTVFFFMYENGKIETFGIDDLNFRDLVHIAKVKQLDVAPKVPVDNTKVVIISHGWSERIGPNYPLIRTLEKVAWSHGWKVVIPDFRASYKYGSSRGRSERIRIIYEEIICLKPKPTTLVLVGHSQGGAASSHACIDRVVQSANIKGLLLIGSENPGSLDGMNWKPSPRHVQIVHCANDQTITVGENESIGTFSFLCFSSPSFICSSSPRHVKIVHCVSDHTITVGETNSKFWGCPYIILPSSVPCGEKNLLGDDINHDFLTKELMEGAVKCFLDFLSLCESDHQKEKKHSKKRK